MIEPVVFWSLTVVVLMSAILVVTLRNIFHAGLALVATFIGVAGFYLALRADFLAVIQILIYAGAIAVLILFAILMTQKAGTHVMPVHNSLKYVGMIVVFSLLLILAFGIKVTFMEFVMVPKVNGLVLREIGRFLLTSYLLPFEIISVVLLAAMIGAIIVARENGK